jgi:phosphatidylserine synthase
MRNTEKLEAMLSLMIVVGMFLLLLDFSPMTATAAAESLEGMPVLTGKTLGK